jgi:mono/diheme cytochrome c family protein
MKEPAMPRTFAAGAFFLLALSANTADAAGDPAVGAALAGMICAACHDIAPTSAGWQGALTPGKPPAFVDVAQDPTHTVAWFQRFLRTPHGRMDNVVLTRSDIDNVSAYILAMRKPAK